MNDTYIIPKQLYRYYQIKMDNQCDDLTDLFFNHNIRFSSPNFNDPFDCKINFDMDLKNISERDFLEFVEALARSRVDWPGYNFNAECRKITESFNNLTIKDEIYKSILDCRFFCLSEEWRSILMWSHYANNHKGACVCFDFSNDMKLQIFPIKYQQEYPSYKLNGNLGDFADKIMLRKSKEWKYEREYRIIDSELKVDKRKIDFECVKGVFLGCNINKDDKVKIIKMLKDVNFKGWLRQIQVSKAAFKLHYQGVDFLD